MSLLGEFKYHLFGIKLEGNSEETEYTVTTSETSLKYVGAAEQATETLVYKFDNIGAARDAFEIGVVNIVNQTSCSDVSLYEQRL